MINILNDVSGASLSNYLQGGNMYLGVDLNENASGNETRDSVGVAIEQLQLSITTTEGEFTFSDFYTNTTAILQSETNPDGGEYYTMFGSLGSNELTGNSDFDISDFDDVITLENIEIDGEIISATLTVSFVDTVGTGENETFFDFSNGFEEFALFSGEDATLLDSADLGLSDSPSGIQYNRSHGAPAPGWLVLAFLPLLFLAKSKHGQFS